MRLSGYWAARSVERQPAQTGCLRGLNGSTGRGRVKQGERSAKAFFRLLPFRL